MPTSKNSMSRDRTATENDDDKYSNNDSIKNKFGLGAEAEAWDNGSYPDDEEDDDGDSYY